MTSEGAVFVIDNNVLSAADAAGWFESISFWKHDGDANIVVSKRVWEKEFLGTHDGVLGTPAWLDVRESNLDELTVQSQGQLSVEDWTCVAVAEQEGGRVVTNDQALYSRFEERGGTATWGTKFLKRTFERCGITPESFDDGVERYVDDVFLPDEVVEAFRNAEKDD
jgi:hypothetical protein